MQHVMLYSSANANPLKSVNIVYVMSEEESSIYPCGNHALNSFYVPFVYNKMGINRYNF